jgi:hypothetical protein
MKPPASSFADTKAAVRYICEERGAAHRANQNLDTSERHRLHRDDSAVDRDGSRLMSRCRRHVRRVGSLAGRAERWTKPLRLRTGAAFGPRTHPRGWEAGEVPCVKSCGGPSDGDSGGPAESARHDLVPPAAFRPPMSISGSVAPVWRDRRVKRASPQLWHRCWGGATGHLRGILSGGVSSCAPQPHLWAVAPAGIALDGYGDAVDCFNGRRDSWPREARCPSLESRRA